MNKKIIKLSIFLLVIHFFIFPKVAHAVIPPDFIFNIGSQIVQLFSMVAIFFTAVFGAFFNFFKTKFLQVKHKKIILAGTIVLIIAISFVSTYFYAIYKQKVEYEKWLAESQKYSLSIDSDNDGLSDWEESNYSTDPTNPDTDGDGFLDGEEVSGGYNPLGAGKIEDVSLSDKNDLLSIGEQDSTKIDFSNSKFVSSLDMTDSVSTYINDYYENIANGYFEIAYEMSKKSVDYETFKGWYQNITKITLDKLVRIDSERSSIEVTLYEGNSFTKYGIVMTLRLQDSVPVNVEKSEVKILSQGVVDNQKLVNNDDQLLSEYDYFDQNSTQGLVIKNQDLKNIIDNQSNNYIVLDAREDLEYEIGYLPGSLHIRFIDLKAGRWIELPKEKNVYVLCWSGMRGKEVAEFLRTKKIVASYLETGASDWVKFGGEWVGNIDFDQDYTDSYYKKVFTTAEVKVKEKEGVFLVDTRQPYKFDKKHITNSVNLPIMYTPTFKIDEAFNQIPANSKIITVCDDYTNCFDAKITGVELERRGHQFLGRYNKPWDYYDY